MQREFRSLATIFVQNTITIHYYFTTYLLYYPILYTIHCTTLHYYLIQYNTLQCARLYHCSGKNMGGKAATYKINPPCSRKIRPKKANLPPLWWGKIFVAPKCPSLLPPIYLIFTIAQRIITI